MADKGDYSWILAALDGEEDILTPAAKKDIAYLGTLSCPKCGGGGITREVNTKLPFVAHDVLSQWSGRCPKCRCLFSPTTGVIVEG